MSKKQVLLENALQKKHNDYDLVKIEEYELEDYHLYGDELLEDDKSMLKVVNRIKSIVRSSMEYKEYVDLLKHFKNMRYCTFLSNIKNFDENTNKSKDNIKIEIHHEPFNLHDIVVTIIRYFLFKGQTIDNLKVAEKVMELHYKNMVGLLPLSLTAHQLVHSESLFVPMDIVYGEYEKFFHTFKEYIPSEVIEKFLYKKDRTTKYNHRENTKVLQTKFTYYENDRMKIPMIENPEEDFEEFIKKIREKKIRIVIK